MHVKAFHKPVDAVSVVSSRFKRGVATDTRPTYDGDIH